MIDPVTGEIVDERQIAGSATYTYELQSDKCGDKALASTGSVAPTAAGIGALALLSAGALVLLLARRRVRAEN